MKQTQNVEPAVNIDPAVTLDNAMPRGTVMPSTPVPHEEKLCADAVTVECEVAANVDVRGRNGEPLALSSRFARMRRSAYWVGLLVGIVITTLTPRVIQWLGGTYSVGAETVAEVEGETGVVGETSAEAAVGASSANGSAPVSIRPPARNAAATALEYAKTVDVQPNIGSGAGSSVAARRSGYVSSAVRTDAAGGVGMGGNVFQIQPVPANTDMIAVSTQLQNPETRESYQQLTLIDTKKKVIAVYHIDAALGQVSLQCVRPFRYDQELQSYYHKDYTGNPLMPSEIQQMLEEQN